MSQIPSLVRKPDRLEAKQRRMCQLSKRELRQSQKDRRPDLAISMRGEFIGGSAGGVGRNIKAGAMAAVLAAALAAIETAASSGG